MQMAPNLILIVMLLMKPKGANQILLPHDQCWSYKLTPSLIATRTVDGDCGWGLLLPWLIATG
jgi:hypothetical protein